MIGFNKDIEYLKNWNKDLALTNDEQEAIDVHIEEILVDGDGDEYDGGYVFEEIENLLIESGELVEEEG